MAAGGRFHDHKLREEALKAFAKAIHTDRMVAVTGAMSTRALGYPSWDDFIRAYAAIASDIAGRVRRDRLRANPAMEGSREDQLLQDIAKRAEALEKRVHVSLDDRVAMWMLHDGFKLLDAWRCQSRSGLVLGKHYRPAALEEFERRVASIFASRTLGDTPFPPQAKEAAIHPLIADLGIKRIATLNYDLELEQAFMLRDDERAVLKDARPAALQAFRKRRGAISASDGIGRLYAIKSVRHDETVSVTRFMGPPGSGKPILRKRRDRLSRTMGHGLRVESDIVDRERPDRLFEFAIGSGEVDRHILHLHGRADVPDSLIADIRQYDRLYRLDDLNRNPFEQSLRVLFGGNPILFVGIGMTEVELNQTLQYFVSNAPVRRPAPTFLIWNTNGAAGDKAAFMEERRLDFRRRLGVHVIFEEDLQAATGDANVATPGAPAEAIDRLGGEFERLLDEARQLGRVAGKTPMQELLLAVAAARPRSDSAFLSCPPAEPAEAVLKALADTLSRLPALVKRVDARIDRMDVWRSIRPRLTARGEPLNSPAPRMWGAEGLQRLVTEHPERRPLERLRWAPARSEARSLVFAAADAGFGRGELAERLIRAAPAEVRLDQATLRATDTSHRLLINAGFSYDSDAMLNGIASFLASLAQTPLADDFCREQAFADLSLFKTRGAAMVVINGADRFFGFDGTPLSAELDHMLRCAQEQDQVQFLILGTERLGRYCEAIGEELQTLAWFEPASGTPGVLTTEQAFQPLVEEDASDPDDENVDKDWRTQLQTLTDRPQDPLRSSYLDWVAGCFEARSRARRNEIRAANDDPDRLEVDLDRVDITSAAAAYLQRTLRIEPSARGRAFFDAYLSPALLNALRVPCPQIFEVLRTMCFIGSPVEGEVLLYAPKVRAILGESPEGTDTRDAIALRVYLNEVLEALLGLGLIVQFEPHEGVKPEPTPGCPHLSARFGLHRALALYLRERHGAPINDAKLATTFNMSLFMSEPSDNYTPEPGFHDELGDLVDHLIGGWHDLDRLNPPCAIRERLEGADISESDLEQLYIHPADRQSARDTLASRSGRIASACLRAALSVVRGYYSTSTLLKLDRDPRRAASDQDGALTEHARRLDRMITGFGDISASRKIVRGALGNSDESGTRHMGSDPFYADDLVWLHNERGVVALAQGHLFDARDAFNAAKMVNQCHVEHGGYHGHNWRRISLNLVATLIERGALKPAERLLDQAEATINQAPWRKRRESAAQASSVNRIEQIRRLFHANSDAPVRGNADTTREEMLIVAMVTGYRGLIAHVRGRYHDALDFYLPAIEILRRLGEQRAFAHFQRHYASLKSFIGDKQEAARASEFAIAAAQSAIQMDILHRSRIVRADIQRSIGTDPNVRRLALQDIRNALEYSSHSDCYRARIEASASLAGHMRHGGDYDTALRYATDALTVAARYGHSLQKTSLRIEIAQILIARGDRRSGESMLKRATAIATSKGYQQALESVRRAQNALEARASVAHRTDVQNSP